MKNYHNFNKSIHLYQKLSHLSGAFSKIKGFQLLVLLFYNILYSSSTLDEIFTPELAGGNIF